MKREEVERVAHVIGVPLDHGAGRRGVGMGPTALRLAGLHDALARVGFDVRDHGDLAISIPETLTFSDPKAKYLPVVVEACRALADDVEKTLDEERFPLVIGGDHAVAIGTVAGIAAHLRGPDLGEEGPPPRIGLLWFDAHADINTPETSPSGNIHGMPIACMLHRGPAELCDIGTATAKVDPERIVQIGLRQIDELERDLIRDSGIHAFTMEDIDRRGIAEITASALEILREGVDHLHISFDVDVLDPDVAPGTGTPVLGGLTYREAHLALEMVAETGRLASFELVEVNPILDQANRTAEVAVELIASALGHTIL